MDKSRSKLGNKLFKLAAQVYAPDNVLRKELGDLLFKLAASVSPDKKKKTTKKASKK